MHRAQLNRGRVELQIEPLGPVLIRSGTVSVDPRRPDLEWVRTRHASGVETVYLPGSSLKGVLRAQAERILRSTERSCCDPLQQKHNRCQTRPDRKAEPAKVFSELCAACRTFGSLRAAGRMRFTDAYPWPLDATMDQAQQAVDAIGSLRSRTGVAIDRKTGATKRGALYDLEVLERGQFHAEISFVNIQLWQLRLLLFTLADLDEGFVRLGSGKSRGLGRVRCRVSSVTFDWLLNRADDELLGTGALERDDAWGLVEPRADRVPLGKLADLVRSTGLFRRLVVPQERTADFTGALDPAWSAFVNSASMAARAAR